MSNLSTFLFEQQQVRFVGTADNPEWIAADVCQCLDLNDTSKALNSLESDEKGTRIVRTLGGEQLMLTVTEPGLYCLIFKSRKSVAKRFKRWVFHEVLPAIRKTGEYRIPVNPHGRRSFVETHHVADSQLKVYCLLKDCDRWMTATEVAEGCGLGKSTAGRHCLYFQRGGLFEMLEYKPKHRYRFSTVAEQRNPSLYHRFETAIEAVGNPFTSKIFK